MGSKILRLFIVLSGMMGATFGYGMSGDWHGRLDLGGGRNLRLILHISESDSLVTMDSPDQNAYGLEGETVFLSEDSVNFRIGRLMMGYAGRVCGDTISGTFQQRGFKFPLSLVRGVEKLNRPQTPQPPFPYKTEEVRIANPTSGALLAGTLTVPENSSDATPAVVLVSGSGLQNRDEELFEHRPFAVIADYLARNGIASLRYDDRGFGESSGDASVATTEDFASDADAVLGWLRARCQFGKTGIVGHSEGGIIAYMLGTKSGGPDFIVSIAGPSVKGTKTIAYQNKVAVENSGVPGPQANDFAIAVENVLEFKLSGQTRTSVSDEELAAFYPQYRDNALTRRLGESLRAVLVSDTGNIWMNYFLAYDPSADLSGLRVPALIVYGEKDSQVPPSLNLEAARKLAPKADVRCYPELNHLMQHAVTGHSSEYGSIEETISSDLLRDIRDFILALCLGG
ncbi:MAG: lysophospholipase [Muribaculum sp.]|nr:lysophospholipase [Muribaculum sp.]